MADRARLPRHVGIIMDGNGRWARRRGLPRVEGHRQGAVAVRETVRAARELGIGVLTLFAFSEQNWERPPDEVGSLMELLLTYVQGERDEILGNGIRLTTIGETGRLPPRARGPLYELCDASLGNRGMTLCLALSYGGREDLVQAARRIAAEVAAARLAPEEVTAHVIESRLMTRDIGDLDLLIRTSGERRISNFLLWPAAYAELHFTDTLWPDFTRADLEAALADYAGRQRRFGRAPEPESEPPS